jgi:hypothetical protein
VPCVRVSSEHGIENGAAIPLFPKPTPRRSGFGAKPPRIAAECHKMLFIVFTRACASLRKRRIRRLLYLPPYSPVLNPIEMAICKHPRQWRRCGL